jgi:hypothetical protein
MSMGKFCRVSGVPAGWPQQWAMANVLAMR